MLIKIYELLTLEMPTPDSYGWFHIVCIASVIGLTILACMFGKNSTDKQVNRFLGAIWVLILSLEIYKQLIFGFDVVDGRFVWDYSWYAFPFQFCSSPLYILPVIVFTKNSKLRDACISYMVGFSFFAGLAVFCYPNDVFVSTIGINIQTMIHHGSQILVGVFLAVRYKDKMTRSFYLSSIPVFAAMSGIAIILNSLVFKIFTLVGIDETFNMFYISPHFDCTLPVLSIVYKMVPYSVFLFIYIFGFALCALIVFGILKGITVSVKTKKASCMQKAEA